MRGPNETQSLGGFVMRPVLALVSARRIARTRTTARKLGRMRDLETIDCELRLLTAVRPVCREHGTLPSVGPVDELLDERAELTGSSPLGHQPRDYQHATTRTTMSQTPERWDCQCGHPWRIKTAEQVSQTLPRLTRELSEGEQARRRAEKLEQDLRTAIPSPPHPPLHLAPSASRLGGPRADIARHYQAPHGRRYSRARKRHRELNCDRLPAYGDVGG